MAASVSPPSRILGRYALYDIIAAGGMATVHFGRLIGPVGFARTVAIKRLHPQFSRDPEFVSMFLDEARLAARIRHPNVVPTLDVVALEGELFLVMEYVQGEPLGALLKSLRRQNKTMPASYAVAVVAGALRGLHAAHEAVDERGMPLGIVHRDVSPQNILVGVDGVARVLDFGVAKAVGRIQTTREGQLKGKMAYMPPEQIRSTGTDRRTDVYAAGAVLWEALAGRRLFVADSDVAVFSKVLEGKIEPPSAVEPTVPRALDAIVLKSLSMSPHDRFETARDMARALEAAVPLVSTPEIGEWVEAAGAETLASRAQTVTRIEADTSTTLDVVVAQASAAAARHSQVDIAVSAPAAPRSQSNMSAPRERSSVSSVSGVDVGREPHAPPGPGEETEITGSSAMHSAVMMMRFPPRRVAAVAGAGLVLVGLVAFGVRLASRGGDEASGVSAGSASAARVEATAAAPPAPIAPAVVPPAIHVPPVAPPTAELGAGPEVAPPAASFAPGQPSAPVAATHGAAMTTAAASPEAGAPPHARGPAPNRSHALETVLDSRK